MEKFNILNHTISFEEGIVEYIKIRQMQYSYKVNFVSRYYSTPRKNITTIEEFVTYVQDLYNNGFSQEFMKLSEELVNLYIKYNIYDVSKELIQAQNSRYLTAHLVKLNPIFDEIKEFISQVQQNISDMEGKWQNIVNEAVPGHYFNMYSSSYTDLLLNDYFNHKEEKRVEKKRNRLYTENASKTVNDYLTQIIPLYYEYIDTIQQIIYEDVIEAINSIYENCALDLVARRKISPFSQYTNSLKSESILANIDKITDKKVIEEQLVNLLQIDPLNIDIHPKVIEFITYNDIPEYAKLIKFLELQNAIFYMYADNYSKKEPKNKELNDKYLNILKLLKNNFDIDSLISTEFATLNYTDKFFIDSVKTTKIFFECLKNIFGNDNKKINEHEQSMFITAIKEASQKTNLVYDGSITYLDYDYLCEFWKKAENKRNFANKSKEITSTVSIGIIEWIKNHIKLIITIIITIIIFSAIKDSDNSTNKVNNKSSTENSFYTMPTENNVDNGIMDRVITYNDLDEYERNLNDTIDYCDPFQSY